MATAIITENRDGILSLTINRPEKKNALTNQMYGLLEQGFMAAAQDPKVRVVLIKGAGDNFTSGNDLNEFAGWVAAGADSKSLPALKFIKQVLGFEKPIVAAVKGVAVGVGTTLLLHCDIVVAGHSAMFNLPFVRLGLVPEFASSMLLPALAGKALAGQVLMLGEPFGLEAAESMGLVSTACSDDQVEEEALAKCRQFVNLPPKSVRTTKALITPPEQKEKLLDTIEKEMRLFAEGLKSEEHREAIQAFFEKRQPDFSKFN